MNKFLFIVTFITLPFMSQADNYSVSNKFYVGFGAVIISPNDVDIDISAAGIVNGVTFSGGITFTGAASRSYDIDGNISVFSMIFGPTLDFDIYENFETLLGGDIGFSHYNDEIKGVGGSTGLSYDEGFTDFAEKFKIGVNYSFTEQTYLQDT